MTERIPADIGFVARKKLCTGCGACAGACRKGAIEMRVNPYGLYAPVVNRQLCDECGLCVRICPGYEFDYRKHHMDIHGCLPGHAALGPYLASFSGYSNDPEILEKAQSGGFVSGVLLYCIKKEIIDGAVVTAYRENAPFKTKTFIARNREEILSATGSKYSPVPASQILGKLLEAKGKFAFVGTSCQIQGMRKAETLFPGLREKIKLYIGLHCLGIFNFHFQDQVLYKLGIERSKVAYFRHKDKAWRGWPCDLRIKDFKGREYNLNYKESRLWPRTYFTPWRCLLCFDKANEFSDVSCGDCRIHAEYNYFRESGYDIKKGLSEFVIRTPRAEKIISGMLAEGIFTAHRVETDSMTKSVGVAGKKLGLETFKKIAFVFGAGIPEYGVSFYPDRNRGSSFLSQMRKIAGPLVSTHYYLVALLARYSFVRRLMKIVPHRVYNLSNSLRKVFTEWSILGNSANLKVSFPGETERRKGKERDAGPKTL